MPLIDVNTVLTLTALNLFTISAAMSLVMGKQLSQAARAARASLVAQALGWSAIVASGYFWDMPLSVLAMACAAASNLLMHRALAGWLGPRPLQRTLMAIAVLMVGGYALSFDSYRLRVGWANLWLAAQFVIMTACALWPTQQPKRSDGWRGLLALCYSAMALLTAIRGILGAWFTELYPSFTTPHPANIAAQVAANICLVLTMMAVLVAWRREVEEKLEEQAHTDALTGLLNRRGWMKHAELTLAHARRHRWNVAILMLDLDHFKHVNDVYGHEVGDRALNLLGRAIQGCLRESDVSGRLGGEEFVLLLPHIDPHDAQALDQRLRDAYRKLTADRMRLELNFSSGIAFCNLQEPDALKKALIQADGAMYQAKASGRGRLCTSPAVNITVPDALIH